MTKEEIKLQVLQCIDEVNELSSANIGLSYPIDPFLNESAEQLLSIAPLYTIDQIADFSKSPTIQLEDGSGIVALPKGFIRLKLFKMECWSRPVTLAHTVNSPVYSKQFNPYQRGGKSRPVVVIDGNSLCYFSVPDTEQHIIEKAEAVVSIDVGPNYPKRLIAPLTWLTASKVLQVMNESQAATDSRARYQELINLL